MPVNNRFAGVLIMMNLFLLGLLLGQATPWNTARAQEGGGTTEEGPINGEAKALDRLPPQMIYQSMRIPGDLESKDPAEMRDRQGFFIYDTVNNTMRIYAFNNLHTKGSRGDIELIAVRDVQWDAMLIDSGLSTRGDDAKLVGKGITPAQGLRPRDIFDMLVKEGIVDKSGRRVSRTGGLTK